LVPTLTRLSPLSLHDALPICRPAQAVQADDMIIRGTLQSLGNALDRETRLGSRHRRRRGRDAGEIAGRARVVTHRVATLFRGTRSEEHTSELQSRFDLVCRLL